MGRTLAAADIGSNTVHLLVADLSRQIFRRVRNEADWLSLGEVVGREGIIPEGKTARLIATLQNFKAISRSCNAEEMYVFATEAMRIASNHEQIIARIRNEVGLNVDVISARREAELSMRGAMMDVTPQEPFALLEVGGGSAQVAVCERGALISEHSLSIGTGRLIAQSNLTQPCTAESLGVLRSEVRKAIVASGMPNDAASVIASGGVARGFIRALHPDGDSTLEKHELEYLYKSASKLTIDQLSVRFSVKVKRAMTLVPGAEVFWALLEHFGAETMKVSEFGVREGAILEMAEGLIKCRA